LYHGCLSNVTANGVNLSGRFKASDFSMFDYVLLGDIHKHQILSYDPITAYAGSLVQLNFG
jgi:DNA repair exonuclease SbcCD nuclease subunit